MQTTFERSTQRFPWPFKAAEIHREVHPEKRSPEAPSTEHEYPNGDRADKSGINLEQLKAVKGVPHPSAEEIHRHAEGDR